MLLQRSRLRGNAWCLVLTVMRVGVLVFHGTMDRPKSATEKETSFARVHKQHGEVVVLAHLPPRGSGEMSGEDGLRSIPLFSFINLGIYCIPFSEHFLSSELPFRLVNFQIANIGQIYILR